MKHLFHKYRVEEACNQRQKAGQMKNNRKFETITVNTAGKGDPVVHYTVNTALEDED